MAKLAIVCALFLALLAFSSAKTASNQPENDGIVVAEPGIEETQTEISGSHVPTSTEETTEQTETVSVPLTYINFRPINRHFPGSRFRSFRHGRPCRFHHHLHRGRRDLNPRMEIPYGRDMIMTGEDDLGFAPVFKEVAHRIPAKWMKNLRSHHDDEEEEKKEHHHRRYHHHHNHDEEEDDDNEHDDDKEHEGGFMKMVRKFLKDQF